MSPNLYLMVVPLIRRNAQPMFNRRSYCNTFTLHPRMAAYTCSSTHAHGTGGTWVRSTRGEALFIGHDLRLGVPVSQCVPVVFLYSPRAVDAYIPQISPRVCVNRLGHWDTS